MQARARIVVVVATAVFVAAAAGSAAIRPPTAYAAPLQAHQTKLKRLRVEIDRLGRLPAPVTEADATERVAQLRRAGNDYLTEARAFEKTLNGFTAGGTRRGLDSEVETIRTTIGEILNTVSAYRIVSGGTVEKPTVRTPSLLEQELRSVLGRQLARRIPDKILAEGVQRMIAGQSLREVREAMLQMAGTKVYASVDAHVRRVTGLGLRDFRDMRRAIRLRANQEVDRAFERLILRSTPNGLVITLAREFVLPWLKARLTELMRPHLTLEQRVPRSIRSLEKAKRALYTLPDDARLSTVHARWADAQTALAATRFLVADVKRAKREGLLAGDYGEALTEVERATDRTEQRFLLHKEDLVKTLAVDRDELHGMLNDMRQLVGSVLVPAVPKLTLEQELLSGGGKWTFGRVKGTVLCTVTFTRTAGKYGAYVLKACHPNESFWRLDGKALVLLHADGTTRTSTLSRRDANYWQGPYLGAPGIPADGTIHYIRR